MNNFSLSLAQDLGVAHKGQWNPGVMDITEAVEAVSRLNNCNEVVARNVLSALEPYTKDPRCNSIFFGAVASHPGAVDNGDGTSLENASFIDLQNTANNVWSIADVSGDLSVVYCNGFVVGLVGIAPAGVDLETYASNVIPNIPNWLYGFMGFVNLVSEGEDGVVSMMLGLVDGSGADLEWFEFDTTQTAYLVAKNLFLNGAAFNSILFRAALYGGVSINGVLFENNDIIAEHLIQAIDMEASGVVDVTPAEAEVGEEDEEPQQAGDLFDEDDQYEDSEELPEHDFFGELTAEPEDDFLDSLEEEDFDDLDPETEADGELDLEESDEVEFDELDLEESDEVEFDELDLEESDEVEFDELDLEESDEVEFDELGLEEIDGVEFDELDPEESYDGLDEGDVLSAEDTKYQPESVSLGRDDLVNVLRRVLGASDSLVNVLIGVCSDTVIDSNTPVNIDAVCHVLAAEFYADEVIQSFILLADQYSGDEATIRCGDAVEAVANAVWGDIPDYSRTRIENHAAGILNRHRDALWLGVYSTDAVVDRLSTLGYNDDVCYRVAVLMEEVKANIDIMRNKLINQHNLD